MSPNLVEVEVVASAIHDSMFDERFDHLPQDSIDRALMRQCAEAAIERLDSLRDFANVPPHRKQEIDPDSPALPQNEEQAALMVLLGTKWLEDHAPWRLTKNGVRSAPAADTADTGD